MTLIPTRCALALVVASMISTCAVAIEPTAPYPGAAPGATAFLNKANLLGNANDPDWFNHNIPFLEVPDSQIQQVYYYRWQTYKEHLVYTGPIYGWLSTEFLAPVFYGAPYGGVNAAAGHQTIEGRWLRNQQYVKDNINYWLNGPGQFPKPRNEAVNPDTDDWAHEYSYWAATSVWQTFLASGDQRFTTAQLPQLVKQYRGWDNHFNAALGLYWQVPVWDATELTPASYQSNDPYHGGPGYRPTINAYQFGDAQAIANIANLQGDAGITAEYVKRAGALQQAMQTRLWDNNRQFYYHMHRDNNAAMALLDTRELQGFVPWMFNMPPASSAGAMRQLFDPQGFAATYGPTTAERRSRWYYHEANNGCCRWNGPSWPYETSQVLTGVANLLIDYPAQPVVNAGDYLHLLHRYAATQFRHGVPYVAEAHDADGDFWIYDGHHHSEDYNHSTFNDNVISGLIGVRGQQDNTVLIKPLAPAAWDYFALENTPYHGHNLTVLWDRTGARYGQGAGLKIYVDGAQVASQANLNALRVNVGPAITQSNADGLVNVAANSQRHAQGTQPIASYVFGADNIWNGIDGVLYRTGIPQNSRWTSYASPHASDEYGANFQREVTLQEVRVTFYDDGGGVRTPAHYDVQYWNGSIWLTIPGQQRAFAAPRANAMNRITFPRLTTSHIRVVANNFGGGTGWGISELQAMSKPVFKIANVNSGKLLAVSGASSADGAQVQQYRDNGSADHLWELVDAGGGYFKLRNINSRLVLGIDAMSGADSALIKQAQDNGTADHLWQWIDNGGGQFKIRSKHSGLLLGVSGMSQADSANVVQFHDNGTPDHLWTMLSANDPR
ncbi:MAG: RICIN domain-containing protein [Pseudomonadota bacterium]